MVWVFRVFRLGAARGEEVWVNRASRAGVIRKEYVELGVGVVRCGSSDILGEVNRGVRQGVWGQEDKGQGYV